MASNRLVEIPIVDWPKLRDLYVTRKHESCSYNLIQNYINWLEKDPSNDVAKIYSLNGDWSDGTFLLIENNFYLMFNTRNDCQDRLLDVFNCLDAHSKYWFFAFPDRLKPTVEKYFAQFDLSLDASINTAIWYHISPADALKFDTDAPEGITLSALSQGDAETINSLWPHRHPGSEKVIGHFIENNPNVGAYEKDGNLIAWCLTLPIGSLGLIHVKDGYKRNGYGNLVTRVLSKKFAKMGVEITAPVAETNVPSMNMFKKLGFKQVDKVNWMEKPELK